MPVESRIARRYLWAARKQAHTAFLSVMSMLGLALGVAATLIAIALLSGLQGQIKGRLIQNSPQVLVEPSGQNMIDDADAVIARARELGMRDIRPYIAGIGYGANEDQQNGRAMRMRSLVRGHEPVTDIGATGAPRVFQSDDAAITLSRAFASSLSLDAGDFIMVIAPRMRLTPFGPVPVTRRFRIARIVKPVEQEEEEQTDAWLDPEEASNLLATGGRPTTIEIYGDATRAEEVQAALAAQFPKLQFKTWKEINRPLFLALRLEKVVMFAAISLIIVVAALNLISSLSMLILDKRPSVGVLRTLGATEGNIRSVFMQLGLLIGLTGTVLGNVVGVGFSWAANKWQFIPPPADAYFISYLPFALDVEDIVGVNAVAVLLSVIATWYPARVASRLDPIAAIKED
jgi:lipoprotein-releasing system permease protein